MTRQVESRIAKLSDGECWAESDAVDFYGREFFAAVGGIPVDNVHPVHPLNDDDPRIAQYERERAEAVGIAHKAMSTSYIGAPPANLRGDADRMVAALLKAGWTPPAETCVEYAVVSGVSHRRRIIVVEDWSEVPRG